MSNASLIFVFILLALHVIEGKVSKAVRGSILFRAQSLGQPFREEDKRKEEEKVIIFLDMFFFLFTFSSSSPSSLSTLPHQR